MSKLEDLKIEQEKIEKQINEIETTKSIINRVSRINQI